jgi:tRNA pseudouridine65 synthase
MSQNHFFADKSEPINILYEDEFCMLINKPSNMLVHHSYSSRNLSESLSLMEYFMQQNLRYYPVHRLDFKTSGIILLAKEKENVSSLQHLFETGKIEKCYLALMRGFLSDIGVIDTPVKNERGNYKEALTIYECIDTFHLNFSVAPYPTARYSKVKLMPKTGRTHQLRIHANKISHPIIGDPRYGNRHHNHYFAEQLGIPFLFLHAHSLSFIHPFLDKEIFVEAPLPEFWNKFDEIALQFRL